MLIILTYKEAEELNDYLKAWDRVKDRSKKGEIFFDQDKLEYDRVQNEVKVELLP